MDLNANIAGMDLAELLEYQQALTRHRKDVLDAQAGVQRELDRRAVMIAERRRLEDAQLGQASKPPTQQLLGDASDAEAGS